MCWENSIVLILFLATGVFTECYTEEDQKKYTRENVFLLYELGAFSSLVQLLGLEIEWVITYFIHKTS